MEEYEFPDSALALAPYWLIPMPWPYPFPEIVKSFVLFLTDANVLFTFVAPMTDRNSVIFILAVVLLFTEYVPVLFFRWYVSLIDTVFARCPFVFPENVRLEIDAIFISDAAVSLFLSSHDFKPARSAAFVSFALDH